MAFRSVFPEEGQWFKGNLHMHTTLSDGRVSPSEAIERYRKNGYDFIAITDHRCPGITVEPGEDGYFGAETVEAGNMLLLSGVEWDTGGANTDLPGDTSCAHILGIGMTSCPEQDIRPLQKNRHPKPQEIIETIRRDGGIAILAHPSWSVMDPSAIRDMKGLTAAEIFNGVSTIPWNGARGDSSAWFDIWATHYGIRMPAVAGDDAHGYDGDECQSFTMVKAASLTRNDIIHALETGSFYASQGPKFLEAAIDSEKGILHIESSTDAMTMVTYSNHIWTKNRVMSLVGNHAADYEIEPGETYVRVEIIDNYGKKAYTSPIAVKG